MRIRHGLLLTVAAATWLAAAPPTRGQGRVELIVAAERRAPLSAQHTWLRALSEAGVRRVRIRSKRPVDKAGIDVRGTGDRPVYVVTAILNSRGELVVPGGRYRRRDADRLARWLDELAQKGPPESREPILEFGLPRSRFEQLRADLTQTVDFSTEEKPRGTVVEAIRHRLKLPMKIDRQMLEALNRDTVREELAGLSCGTALACVLRPMGVGMVPRVSDDEGLEYVVTTARRGQKVWPIGHPPEKRKHQVLPAMFELLNVNIQNVSAAKALESIGKRLEVPVLLDHNALARHGIEPDKVQVSLPRSHTTYGSVLRRVLFQARLKSELRVDEAGKPLLWITSIKPI